MFFSVRCLTRTLLVSLIFSPATLADTPAQNTMSWLSGQDAHYKLTLVTSTGHSTRSASGTMHYELKETPANWLTHQRIDVERTSATGKTEHLVSDYTATESKDGHSFIFQTRQQADNAIIRTISGKATRTGTDGYIEYAQPLKKTLPLSADVLFPVHHTAAILSAASDGKNSLALRLFDGTDEDGSLYTFATLTGWQKPATTPAFPALTNLPETKVTLAYFSHDTTEMMPDYTLEQSYFKNGVSDTITLDFGVFSMTGTLQSLSLPVIKDQKL